MILQVEGIMISSVSGTRPENDLTFDAGQQAAAEFLSSVRTQAGTTLDDMTPLQSPGQLDASDGRTATQPGNGASSQAPQELVAQAAAPVSRIHLPGLQDWAFWAGKGVEIPKLGMKGTVYQVVGPDVLETKGITFIGISFKDPRIVTGIGLAQVLRGLTGNGTLADSVAGASIAGLQSMNEALQKTKLSGYDAYALMGVSMLNGDVVDMLRGRTPQTAAASMGVILISNDTKPGPLGKDHFFFATFGELRGGPEGNNRNLTFGFGVEGKVGKLPDGVYGGSYAVRVRQKNVDGGQENGPWVVTFPHDRNKEVVLPEVLARAANAAFKTNAPIVPGVSIEEFAARMGLGEDFIPKAAAAIETFGPAASVAMQGLGLASAFSYPPAGIAASVQLTLDGYHAADRATARAMAAQVIEKGGFDPKVFRAMLPKEMGSAELVAAADIAKETINLYLERNPNARGSLEAKWKAASFDRNGDSALRFVARAVTGDYEGALKTAREMGEEIPTYGNGANVFNGAASDLAPPEKIAGYAGTKTPFGDFAQVAIVRDTSGGFGIGSPPGRGLMTIPLQATTLAAAQEEARQKMRDPHADVNFPNYFMTIPSKPPIGTPASDPVGAIPTNQSRFVSQGWVGAVDKKTGEARQVPLTIDSQTGKFFYMGADGTPNEIKPVPGGAPILTREDARARVRQMIENGAIVKDAKPLAASSAQTAAPVASIPVDQSQMISQGYAGAINLSTGTSHQALVSQNMKDGKFYWTDKNGKAHEIEPAAGKPAITTRQEAMDRVREMIRFGAISPANLRPLDNPSPGPGAGLRFTP